MLGLAAFLLLDTPIILAAAGLLVIATGLLFGASFILLQSRKLQMRRDRAQRLTDACSEAKTIVDLMTPATVRHEPVTTAALRSLADRVQRLDGRITPLAATCTDGRVVEALEDLHLVAISLGAALDAERSLRVETGTDSPSQRADSLLRMQQRSAELDLAATNLIWLVQTTA
ncbi:MAG: hypothetical protein ACR2QO_03550 [Acidimicrobiales bacterium]